MILSLTAGVMPSVRVVLAAADVPPGVAWTVTASYVEAGRTLSYRPRGGAGLGTGDQVVLIDAAAPIGVVVTYKVSTGATGTIRRTSPAGDVMTDLRGSTYAVFERTASGGDARTPDVRAYFSEVPGSPYMPVRLAPVAGVGTGSFEAVTDTVHTWAMRDLLAGRQQPVYLLHTCPMLDCDIPRTQLVVVVAAPSDRREAGYPERVWSITYRPTVDPEPNRALALNVWDDLDEAGRTWNQLDAMALTWDQFDLTDWDAL